MYLNKFYDDFSNIAELDIISNTENIIVMAVKLELGSIQTLAHQDADGNWILNDPPPDKGMELLKCIQSTADSSDTYANKVIATTETAAPVGYGLGKVLPETSVSDCNEAKASGWYRTDGTALNQPAARPCWMVVDGYSSTWTHQTWFYDQYGGCVAERFQLNGVWQPWEWVNPPMELGVEYRTTERWSGKAVYTKLINFGAMPNNTTGQFIHGISGITQVIRCVGQNITEQQTIPSNWKGNYTDCYADKNACYIHSTADSSASTAYIQMWYTKD